MIPGSLRRVSPGALLGFGSAALLAVFAFLFRDYRTDHFFSMASCVCSPASSTPFLPRCSAGCCSGAASRSNPVSAGLVAGVLGGLAGVGMLELHCPNFQACARACVAHCRRAFKRRGGSIGGIG
jgi:hypothetical protein